MAKCFQHPPLSPGTHSLLPFANWGGVKREGAALGTLGGFPAIRGHFPMATGLGTVAGAEVPTGSGDPKCPGSSGCVAGVGSVVGSWLGW